MTNSAIADFGLWLFGWAVVVSFGFWTLAFVVTIFARVCQFLPDWIVRKWIVTTANKKEPKQ